MSIAREEDRSATADRTEVGERIAASLEAIAHELRLIRAHLDGTGASAALIASRGPWLRHRPPH